MDLHTLLDDGPFALLRRVKIATPFSPQKMAAIHQLKYMAAARCYFQTESRFWERDPLGPLGGLNLVGTDTMAGRVWSTSSQQADPTLGPIEQSRPIRQCGPMTACAPTTVPEPPKTPGGMIGCPLAPAGHTPIVPRNGSSGIVMSSRK